MCQCYVKEKASEIDLTEDSDKDNDPDKVYRNEIDEIWERFDTDNDGKLSKEEAYQFLNDCMC